MAEVDVTTTNPGTAGNGGDPAATSSPPVSQNWASVDWKKDVVPEEFRNDQKLWPLIDGMPEKSLPDMIKGYANLRSHMGKALFIKDRNNPEELAQARAKAYEMGIFNAPPKDPSSYAKHALMPDEGWQSEYSKALREKAHAKGVPNEFLQDVQEIHLKMIQDAQRAAQENQRLAQEQWDLESQQAQQRVKDRAASEGYSWEQILAYAGRWLKSNTTPEQIKRYEDMGVADDADLMWLIAKAGINSGEDISNIDTTVQSNDPDLREALDIMNNPENPLYKKYQNNDQAVRDKVDAAFKKAYPGTVTL